MVHNERHVEEGMRQRQKEHLMPCTHVTPTPTDTQVRLWNAHATPQVTVRSEREPPQSHADTKRMNA